MRYLLKFLGDNYFPILFILLEIICFILISNNDRYYNSKFMNTQREITSRIYESKTNILSYFTLGRVNDSLAADNLRMHKLLDNNYYSNSAVVDTSIDKIDSNRTQVYSYMSAYVINNTTDRDKNFITLDKGSIHGVKKNMGVFNDKGIVGIIVAVSKNYSLAMSILNTESRISVTLKKNNYFGNLEWDEDKRSSLYCKLTKIPNHVILKKGDTVVTSTFGSFYPANLMVGTVEKFSEIQGSNLQEVQIRLSAEMQALHHVYIINFMNRDEVQALQDSVLEGGVDE